VRGSRMADTLFGAAFTLAGAWVWVETRGFPTLRDGHPGPALFPGLLALAMIACGLAVLLSGVSRVTALRSEVRSLRVPGRPLLHVGVVVLLGLLYPLFHARLGFVPTAAALIFGVSAILRANLAVAAVVTAAGTAIIFYAFTRLLGVPL
jgi:hypothetical protein